MLDVTVPIGPTANQGSKELVVWHQQRLSPFVRYSESRNTLPPWTLLDWSVYCVECTVPQCSD